MTITARSTASRRDEGVHGRGESGGDPRARHQGDDDSDGRRHPARRQRRSARTARRSTDAPITWSYTYTAPEGNTAEGAGRRGHHRQRPVRRELSGRCTRSWRRPAARNARTDDRSHAARRAAAHHGHRPRHHPRHAHVRPLAVHRQGRPRLLHRRHLGRRRLRAHLRHHGPHEHRQDGLGEGRRAHDQRRHRLARRALRRAVARGRVEPRERRRVPRPGRPGASEGRRRRSTSSSPAACTTCSRRTTTCSRSRADRST